MKTATISETKNGLSSLLDQVKAGEPLLITDRGVPVARVEPVATSDDPAGRKQRLARAGLLSLGSGALPQEFLDGPSVNAPRGYSLVESVLEERRSGW
ncbi:MAG: type II toxin-antitoxin system prevent-host-death family antitoxin [Chloroflexota bacterium]|nr:type II toxin-antitoxin system prevent-host-death family antitoxin [Chloroflexota bacterium]